MQDLLDAAQGVIDNWEQGKGNDLAAAVRRLHSIVKAKRTLPTVKIEVRGGVAELVKKSEGVKVIIRDFDNEEAGDECRMEVWAVDETVGGRS
jgi:hypothetical protein